MAKYEPSKKNTRIDPYYPFNSWLNESGETIYSVPLEAPEDTTLENPIFEKDEMTYTEIRFWGGKTMRVHFVETTDRNAAYDQCAYLNTLHSQQRRYEKRYQLLETYEARDPFCCIWDYYPTMHRNDDGYTIAEYSDLPEQIETLLKEKYRTNELYLEVYRLHTDGYTPKQISEHLGIAQAMVYFYAKEALQVAQEYRKACFDEGQYIFPAPENRCRKRQEQAGKRGEKK